MYSFHSSADEKNKLLYTLAQHGIETTVDRVAKKNRIKDWIQNSVISEEDEVGYNIYFKYYAFLFKTKMLICRKKILDLLRHHPTSQ